MNVHIRRKGTFMNYSRVVITGSVYNLFFNLLVTPEEALESSFYFTCETIHESIRKNLSNSLYIPDMHHIGKIKQVEYILKFQYLHKFFYPFLSNAKIYAQDHLPFSPLVIGRRSYTLTEDGPSGFKSWEKEELVQKAWERKRILDNQKGLIKIKTDLINPIHNGIFANNDQCKEIMITGSYVPDFAKGKKIIRVNLDEQWSNSSSKKREYILNIFNLDQSDLQCLQEREVIIFTQPFFEDHDVDSLEEHIDIYREIINNYPNDKVVIKTHPRETTDYNKFFPDVFVFNKPMPFQLLALAGVRFKEAATVFSSSVLGFPYPIKVNWVGAKINPKLLRIYGDYIPEELKKK